ncbi:unnamed protein product [Phytophthora fragariaefolia]|uniref:Unnamed protein product n=1 Tax=Phytophthora fragariaefolia TaxID=1490495 RepID=A0A9W6XDZ1_9STRA|nr:unnamed protein product [Phytophthora fragariaefolia]
MHSSTLGLELQCTLNELCADLFATPALDDCNGILQSLALLADMFPQAQALLGRLLAQKDSSHDNPRYVAVSKLSSLSTNFLYKRETSRSAVFLFAALAHNNLRNQQRIVQSTTGVKLAIDPTKCGQVLAPQSTLYALTVPANITNTYRSWRKRQRELKNCRLPAGVPPTHDGIPMPCYCDDCLGAEQFLLTWQQHFHDLSRWSRDVTAVGSSSSLPPLSAEDFFRVFLADYQLRVCSIGEALGSLKTVEESYSATEGGQSSLLYYFVPPEELTTVTPRTSVLFNPLSHVSAIAVAAGIDVDGVRDASHKAQQHGTAHRSNAVESDDLAADQVILFTRMAGINSCVGVLGNGTPSSDDTVDGASDFNADFCKLEEQHGQLVPCDSLTNDIGDGDSELNNTVRDLLLEMLSFCDSSDQIPLAAFRRSFCRIHPQEGATPRELESIHTLPHQVMHARVVMTAKLSDQVLQIDCTPANAETTLPCPFSARIAQQELVGTGSTAENSGLSVLCLSEEALDTLLQRCRICMHEGCNAHEERDIIYLRPSKQEEEEQTRPPDTSAEMIRCAAVDTMKTCTSISVPLSGLSSEATRQLAKLGDLVLEDKYRRLAGEDLTLMMEKIARVVADCNDRISYLSLARDKELIRAASEVHRSAAISRCRHCRDLLIQLGKKLALHVKPLGELAPVSQGKLLRVAKLVRVSIQEILAQSETFDPWETPDARVEKLNLDHRLWASGFPDAAYYQDAALRQRENRKTQQRLSRKLLLQQKKKKLKDEAKIKQRSEY